MGLRLDFERQTPTPGVADLFLKFCWFWNIGKVATSPSAGKTPGHCPCLRQLPARSQPWGEGGGLHYPKGLGTKGQQRDTMSPWGCLFSVPPSQGAKVRSQAEENLIGDIGTDHELSGQGIPRPLDMGYSWWLHPAGDAQVPGGQGNGRCCCCLCPGSPGTQPLATGDFMQTATVTRKLCSDWAHHWTEGHLACPGVGEARAEDAAESKLAFAHWMGVAREHFLRLTWEVQVGLVTVVP